MKRVHHFLALGILAGSLQAATIAHLQFVSESSTGVFIFNVDGALQQLFCNQFLPNVSSAPYTANVATLADLTGSTLFNQNDPDALFKYQRVAILHLLALADPLLAPDVVWANRRIVDGHGPLDPAAQALYDFALAADASSYQLSGFRIYTNELTQEVSGFDSGFELNTETPEPAAFLLTAVGLAALGVRARRRMT